MEEAKEELYAANGTRIATLGSADVSLQLEDLMLDVSALVTEHVKEPLLGIDWLKHHGWQLDFSSDTATIKGRVFPLVTKSSQGMCRRIVAVHQEEIPAWSQSSVEGRVELSSLQGPRVDNWCTEIGEVQPGLCVARAVIPDRLDHVPVLVMNVTSQAIVLRARSELTELIPIDAVMPSEGEMKMIRTVTCDASSPAVASEMPVTDDVRAEDEGGTVQEEGYGKGNDALLKSLGDLGVLDGSVAAGFELEPLIEGVSNDVTPEEKEDVRKLLLEFRDVFSQNEYDIGETSLGEHAIDTGDAKPIRQPLRRHLLSTCYKALMNKSRK